MDAEPFFRVVRGKPDAAELAALTTVLAALTTAPAESPPRRRRPARWRRPERAPAPRGARSWRAVST
jgi:acyl-CoA carboxylase epsilon subunit-like protein